MWLRVILSGALLAGTGCVSSQKYEKLEGEKAQTEAALLEARARAHSAEGDAEDARRGKQAAEARVRELGAQAEACGRDLAVVKEKAAEVERAHLQEVDELKDQAAWNEERMGIQLQELKKQVEALRERGGAANKKLSDAHTELQQRYQADLEKAAAELDAQRRKSDEEQARLRTALQAAERKLAEEQQAREALRSDLDRVATALRGELSDARVPVVVQGERVVITVEGDSAFAPASATLKDDVKPTLRRVAGVLAEFPGYELRVEGHTDNQPVKTPRFSSNWALSSARAAAVLEYLLESGNLETGRGTAVGQGQSRPVARNDTQANRKKNRRMEIVLVKRPVLVGGGAAEP
ncbi:MAG: OmpA family protein [Myxococcota bacterium]